MKQPDVYPSPNELQNMDYLNSWVPPTLKNLLGILIPNELKRVSIAHAIISASRRSLSSPLLFGVGVQLDHSFGSKWLNNHLSRLGFSATYDEVWSYKKAAMETVNIIPGIPSGSFVQWSADNVDHNTRTLDGKKHLSWDRNYSLHNTIFREPYYSNW